MPLIASESYFFPCGGSRGGVPGVGGGCGWGTGIGCGWGVGEGWGRPGSNGGGRGGSPGRGGSLGFGMVTEILTLPRRRLGLEGRQAALDEHPDHLKLRRAQAGLLPKAGSLGLHPGRQLVRDPHKARL